MRVVVVVPALAEAEERHPPVAGVVVGLEAALPEHVGGGVDHPGRVQADRDAQEDGPVHHPPAAPGQQTEAEHGQRHPVIGREPAIERVLAEIGRVAGEARRVAVLRFAEDDPSRCAQKPLTRGECGSSG